MNCHVGETGLSALLVLVLDLWLWVINGCADVATGKRRVKSADAECGCVGKRRMCG